MLRSIWRLIATTLRSNAVRTSPAKTLRNNASASPVALICPRREGDIVAGEAIGESLRNGWVVLRGSAAVRSLRIVRRSGSRLLVQQHSLRRDVVPTGGTLDQREEGARRSSAKSPIGN